MMQRSKINLKTLRKRCKAKGIPTITALAKEVNCARPVIYFALENPSRYSRVYREIMEVLK